MKHSIFILLLFSFSTICFPQNRSDDEKAINAQTDAFITSWNNHDFSDMNKYTTEDIEFVNPVGMFWKGRKELQYAFQTLHKGMFKNTDMKKVATHIRFIKNDVAIAYVTDHTGAATDPNGKPMGNDDNISTYVLVKRNGTWRMASGHVVTVNSAAAPGNPVNSMPKQ